MQTNNEQTVAALTEKDDEERTPKNNQRKERINETRPMLVFHDSRSLNTIPE